MRTLAVLGRPNVGKSTLFNRLVGQRRALVHDRPGVTRDRLLGDAHYSGLRFKVIDTAGMAAGAGESLEARLTATAMAALAEADVGLLVIDARDGINPRDVELAALLRRSGKPVLLAANKSEGRGSIAAAGEAWSLGLGEPIPISAEHGLGIVDLIDALRPHLETGDDMAAQTSGPAEGEAGPDHGLPDEPRDDVLRLAVVGRPNVGKSSLINRLIEQERLLTGPEPGLTRDAVDIAWNYDGRRVQLVDTAGLRRKAKIDDQVEKLSASSSIRAIKGAHVVLLVADAADALQQQDLAIADLVAQEGRALVFGLNKWDLVAQPQMRLGELRALAEEKLSQLRGLPLLTLSALTGRGLDRLLPAVLQAFERWQRRVPTGQLNRWLREAVDRHPPPLAQNRRIKIRYVTQTTNRPPSFALFANKPAHALPDSYLRYLSTSLRDTFDLAGVPLRLRVRHGENPYHFD